MNYDLEAWSARLRGMVQGHFDAITADVGPKLLEARWHTEWIPGIYRPLGAGLVFRHERGEDFRLGLMVGASANAGEDELRIFVDICLDDGSVLVPAEDVGIPIAGPEQELIEAVAKVVDRGLSKLREHASVIVDYMNTGSVPEEDE